MARHRPSQLEWSNQDLGLYHGTTDAHAESIVRRVDLSAGRARLDFGRGFYTTTDFNQARRWARLLANLSPGQMPSVLCFRVSRDRLAALDALWFVRGGKKAEDYWSFVEYCRQAGRAHGRRIGSGWYDVVAGPVAAVWWDREIIVGYDQISFHTEKAAGVLNASAKEVLS